MLNFIHPLQVFVESPPNWLIAAVVGAVIGSFLADLPKLILFPFRMYKNKWIFGRWYHYFVQIDRVNTYFVEEDMIVSRGVRHPFVFSRRTDSNKESEYYGHIEFEKGFCILKSSSIKEEEQLFQRFKITALHNRQNMVGVCCSQDYEGRASVNSCLMSRVRLSEVEFFDIIRSRIGVHNKNRLMFVRH